MGVEAKVLEKSGAWYAYNGEKIGQGSDNAREFLSENPDAARSRSRTRCAPRSAFRCLPGAVEEEAPAKLKVVEGLSCNRGARSSSRALTGSCSRSATRAGSSCAGSSLRHARRPRGDRGCRRRGRRRERRRRGRGRDRCSTGSEANRFLCDARFAEALRPRRAAPRLRHPAHRRTSWRSMRSRCRLSLRSRSHASEIERALPPCGARRFRRLCPRRRRARARSRASCSAAAFRPSSCSALMRRPRPRAGRRCRERRSRAPTERRPTYALAARRPRRVTARRPAWRAGSRATFPGDFPGVRPVRRTRPPSPPQRRRRDEDPRIPGQGNPAPASASPCRAAIPAFSVREATEAAQSSAARSGSSKAQIHAGGRGKGGGVKLARSQPRSTQLAGEILGMQLITHQTGPAGPEGAPPADRGRRRHQEGVLRRRR